ncbi:glycosyltransferase, partial [Citrobacter werkmanii]|uniref:glycosyltransferase family 2 protein n=1 Tax=Citrobacter werkmanii TaxID=67827 RepID=UPI001376E247
VQDFDKNAKNIIKHEYPIDIYWNKLMPQHRWLGIWPCAAFKKNNSNKSNKTIENNIYSFFHPLLSTLPEERNKLEKRLIAKFNNGTALAEDYHELSKLYRSHGMYEIADYFHHQYTGENEKIQQDTNWPLLSVIITTYNQVDVLMKTLSSVLRQRYPNIEVVVIDDASTDHTAARLAEIDDPRLTIIRNKTNQKGAGNLRSGLNLHTKGEYIFIIDHDDLLLDRDYLMDAVLLMEKDKSLAFVFARYLELHEAKNMISNANYYATTNNITNGKKYFLDIQKSGFPGIMFLTTVFRRSAAIKTKAIVHEGVIDFHLFSRLMLAGNVGFINRISSIYRIHEK